MAQIPGYLRPAPASRPSSILGILGALGPDRDRGAPAPADVRGGSDAASPPPRGVGPSGRG